METSEFKDYAAEDFRTACRAIQREVEDLQRQRQELMKQRRTLETVMYMLFPKEAIRDGYMSANAAVAQRLRHAKQKREHGRVPSPGSASSGALRAENIARAIMPGLPPTHVVR